jgi:hypothetical protein
VLALCVGFGLVVDHRFQLDKSAEADNIVEVNAGVPMDEQMTGLFKNSRSWQCPAQELIKGGSVGGRVPCVVRSTCARSVIPLVCDQLKVFVSGGSKFQSTMRDPVELIPLPYETFVSRSGNEGATSDALVVYAAKLALDVAHRQTIRTLARIGGSPSDGTTAPTQPSDGRSPGTQRI